MHKLGQVGAEKGRGFQELVAERPMGDDIRPDAAVPRKAGQEESVRPDDKADHEAGAGAEGRSARPEQSAEKGGCDLGNGREGQETDGGEGRVARSPVIGVREKQHSHDRDAPDGEHEASEIRLAASCLVSRNAREPFAAQHHRQNEVVRDHDGERHRFDDHHGCRGRKSSEEGGEGDEARAVLQRKRQDRHVAIDLAFGEGAQSRERQRDDEDVDEHEIERKEPGNPPHVLDGAVLDHHHVELARQKERGDAGQEREREVCADAGRLPEKHEIRAAFGDPRQDRVHAAEHPEGDVDPDHQEGDELHDRLERDGQHEPVLVLGGVRVAGAERNCEACEHHGHDKRQIAEERHRASERGVGGREKDAEGRGDGFELQGDVGDRAHDGDQAHDGGDALAFAVAGSHEVGDRGDVLRLGDAHDARHQRLAEADDEDRPDIDGEEVEAGAAGEADGPEERPRGAIDRQRERVDGRARRPLHEAASRLVAPMGDREQAAQVDEGRQNDRPTGDHGVSLTRTRPSLAV
jgi:hypothetical protein